MLLPLNLPPLLVPLGVLRLKVKLIFTGHLRVLLFFILTYLRNSPSVNSRDEVIPPFGGQAKLEIG